MKRKGSTLQGLLGGALMAASYMKKEGLGPFGKGESSAPAASSPASEVSSSDLHASAAAETNADVGIYDPDKAIGKANGGLICSHGDRCYGKKK